jgi:hypothetical protein
VIPAFNYALLAFILVLLGWYVYWRINLPPGYSGDRYGNAVIGLMLLFNLLAFGFRWPIAATVLLRTLALVWLVFAIFYITSQSRRRIEPSGGAFLPDGSFGFVVAPARAPRRRLCGSASPVVIRRSSDLLSAG